MGRCLEKLTLMKDKKDSQVKIRIHKTTIRIGHYQLLRIYEWFGKVIGRQSRRAVAPPEC